MSDTASLQELQRKIESSRAKYDEYDSATWLNAYFDEATGGYLVVDVERERRSHISKNEQSKYNKEWEMALVFARNGYRVEMQKELPRISSPDVRIDGVPAELKRTANAGNIVKYAKKATAVQGAKVVLFQFDAQSQEIRGAIENKVEELRRKGYSGYYFFTGENKVYRI